YRTVAMSPNEDIYRVTTIKKPFSYFVPVANFGSTEAFVNTEGKSLYTVLDRGLRSGNPDAVAATTPAAGAGGQPGGRAGGGGGPGARGANAPATPMAQPPNDPTQQPPVTDPTNPNQPPTDPTQPPVDPDAPPRPFQPAVDPDGKRELGWRPDGVGLSYLQ